MCAATPASRLIFNAFHRGGEPTPCSSHTAAAVAGHPPASPAVAGGSRAATATEQTQHRVTRPPLCVRSLGRNGLDDSAKQAVSAAWGDRNKDAYKGGLFL